MAAVGATRAMRMPQHGAAIALCMYSACIIYCAITCSTLCSAESKPHCYTQIPGHFYPALFFALFARTMANRRPRWYQNGGLVFFGVWYVFMDLCLHKGKLDMSDQKTVQHATFTLSITCFGAIRQLCLCPGRCTCCNDVDATLFAAITLLFVFFVIQHPQPNAIGNAMHLATVTFAVAAYLLRIAAQLRAAVIMLVAGACTFVHSQLALTQFATQHHIDPVAYMSASTTVAMAVGLSFARVFGGPIAVASPLPSSAPAEAAEATEACTVPLWFKKRLGYEHPKADC